MPGPKNACGFKEALEAVHALPVGDRRKKVVEDLEMRLESMSDGPGSNDIVLGDFTRIVNDDFPAILDGENLAELEADELGLCCAFLYDAETSVLVFQFDPKKVSPNRAVAYLSEFGSDKQFYLEPITNADAWERFATGEVRKVRLTVAAPSDFTFAGDSALGGSMSNLASAYEAPYITVEIGMGHGKGSLAGLIKDHVSQMVGQEDVRALTVKTAEEGDAFSLLNDLMVYRNSIQIPADPEASSSARQNFLSQAYLDKRAVLRQMFGDN